MGQCPVKTVPKRRFGLFQGKAVEVTQNKDISTTFQKGLLIMRAISTGRGAKTIASLSRQTGFDRATVRRLCLTLVQEGFALQSDQGFLLSPRILTFAGDFLSANDIGLSVEPQLTAFAERLGGDIGLAVLDGARAVYVAHSRVIETRISFGFTTGSTLPLLPTAIGRMLLAGAPEPERVALIAQAPLEQHTTTTCMDRSQIADQIRAAAQSGASCVTGEFEDGICGLAVPIGRPGQAKAVLGTSIPASAPDLARRQDHALDILRDAARTLKTLNALQYW